MTEKDISGIEAIFVGYPEIKYTNISINENIVSAAVQLTKRDVRKEQKQRDVFSIEKILLEKLSIYEQK